MIYRTLPKVKIFFPMSLPSKIRCQCLVAKFFIIKLELSLFLIQNESIDLIDDVKRSLDVMGRLLCFQFSPLLRWHQNVSNYLCLWRMRLLLYIKQDWKYGKRDSGFQNIWCFKTFYVELWKTRRNRLGHLSWHPGHSKTLWDSKIWQKTSTPGSH